MIIPKPLKKHLKKYDFFIAEESVKGLFELEEPVCNAEYQSAKNQ